MKTKLLSLLFCLAAIACGQVPEKNTVNYTCTGIASLQTIDALSELACSDMEFDMWADYPFLDSCVFSLPDGFEENDIVRDIAKAANLSVISRYLESSRDIAMRLEDYDMGWQVKTEPVVEALPLFFNDKKAVMTAHKAITLLDDRKVEESADLFNTLYETGNEGLGFISTEELSTVGDNFWEMYDKKKFVADIDSLQAGRPDYLSAKCDEEGMMKIRSRRLNATSLDEFAIYAIEENIYARFSDTTALAALGAVIEAREYTPYLAEVYFCWRPTVQENYFGLSNDSVIPNVYYDAVRTVCIETCARHIAEHPDDLLAKTLCANLIYQRALRRFAWVGGNECAISQMNITKSSFLQKEEEDE